MSDVSTEENLLKGLKLPSNLEDVLYQFIKLYDSWSVEQRMVGKREAEMIKAIETFSTLEEKLKNDIQVSISRAAIVATDVIRKEVQTDLRQGMEGFSQYWKPLIKEFEAELAKLKVIQAERQSLGSGTIGVLAFVLGMVIMYLIMR